MSKGIEAIQAERYSQLNGPYTPEHDAKYTKHELLLAAEAHLYYGEDPEAPGIAKKAWPWDPELLHLNTPVSSLAKAGALIAAEIDRRFAAGECKETDFGHPFPEPAPVRKKFESA